MSTSKSRIKGKAIGIGKGGNVDARPGLAMARLAYLYGVGNEGIPLRKVERLLEIAQCHGDTLRKKMSQWDQEMEEIAKTMATNPLSFGLSEDVIEAHRADVEFLRNQMDSLKSEHDSLHEITANLEDLLERLTFARDFPATDAEKAFKLLDRYLATSANRKNLLSLFMATQKRWMESGGVQSTLTAWQANLTETAKRKARFDTPANPGGDGPGDGHDLPSAAPSRFQED